MQFLSRITGHYDRTRIYLDYAAATPLRHEVAVAMREIYESSYANPSSIHAEGVTIRKKIEAAREHVAGILEVRSDGVVFTTGGTESNNLAVFGAIEAARVAGTAYEDMEVITTKLEHPSLLRACEALVGRGVTVHYAPVDVEGIIELKEFGALVSEKTVLVATAYVNSEIGTIQPLRKLSKVLKEVSPKGLLLVDGAQAPLWLPCQLDRIGADILTLDGGKVYGPKGSGVIALRHGVELAATLFGGGQEAGLRPGTENPALIVGLETALAIAQENHEMRQGYAKLRDYFIEEMEKIDGVVLNGSRENRVTNNINISIPGIDSEFAVITLDEKGVAASTKSACSGARSGLSEVVMAISGDAARAASTIRFTLGETTNQAQIDKVVAILREHVERVRHFDKK